MKLMYKCEICGKLTTGRKPRGGDGSGRYPRKHKIAGERCLGSFSAAEWVDAEYVDGQYVEVRRKYSREQTTA